MHQYELTERGKIAIAALIVAVLLILSALLVVMALANRFGTPPDSDREPGTTSTSNPSPSEPPSETTNSPPPNGGGFTPPDASPPVGNNGSNGNEGQDGQNGANPSGVGPTGGNPSEGTLSFSYSPDNQTELDAETVSLLSMLLSSPNNSLNSTIAVETPILPVNHVNSLMASVVGAFAAQGVPEQRIAHAINPSAVAEGEIFEVRLYFIPASEK